jgi:hypothetical protein
MKKRTISKGDNGRDETGRFVKGWQGGPGNPQVQRLAEYRNALSEAVSPRDLKRVLDKMVKRAQSGDMLAAKILLDRCLGKASTAPASADKATFELPTVASTKDAVTATNALMRAMSEGRLTPDDASKMAVIVDLARRTLETHDLAERVEALEREQAGAES